MINFNFYCIGAQKAGTTTLHDVLKNHPQIFLPKEKEAHFFDEDIKYQKGMEWYSKTFFSKYANEKIVGSITPEYSFYPFVAERIFNSVGNQVKIIFILRNPVDRAISHYNMSRGRMYEALSFERAIAIENERIKKSIFNYNHFSYINRGYYVSQIQTYLQFFSKESIMFLDFDLQIKNNIQETVEKIYQFLDVPTVPFIKNVHSNESFEYKKNFITQFYAKSAANPNPLKKLLPEKLKYKVREFLLNKYLRPNSSKLKIEEEYKKGLFNKYFSKEFQELQEITGLDLSHWTNQKQ